MSPETCRRPPRSTAPRGHPDPTARRAHRGDFGRAVAHCYERARIARAARGVLLAREVRRICHAKGVARLVRNDLWKDPTPERLCDAPERLHGGRAGNCLAA